MKVTVLVPSAEYKTYAGARIRYRRLVPELARNGVDLGVEDIGEFDPVASDCQVVLISKCHEPQALILAAMASDAGKLVGVDLFDDYFSQHEDSRLVRFRTWLMQLLPYCDFVLCSTEAMAKVVQDYGRQLPIHVLNDPGPAFDEDELFRALAQKIAEARRSNQLRVAWFGVGDNPFFPVGLEDLGAFGHTLNDLAKGGMAVELEIVTNRRALNADGLTLIQRLPVPFRVTEWSESAEQHALRRALLAFLPVNAQPFSIAKSLNRAVTALSAGCQILSVGYPLYAALDPLIYRDAATLLCDLAKGRMRVTLVALTEKLNLLASPATEADRLASFLHGLTPSRSERQPIMLVHGRSTRAEAHDRVQAADGLSIASPYCTASLAFDVIFRFGAPELQLLLSRKAADRIPTPTRRGLVPAGRIEGEAFFRLDDRRAPLRSANRAPEPFPYQFTRYGHVMDEIRTKLRDLFGPCRIIVSEIDRLPLWPTAREA